MGRQALAGVHPVTITALRKTPQELGSAIRDEHVKGECEPIEVKECLNVDV
jgi:hypothetical protein